MKYISRAQDSVYNTEASQLFTLTKTLLATINNNIIKVALIERKETMRYRWRRGKGKFAVNKTYEIPAKQFKFRIKLN